MTNPHEITGKNGKGKLWFDGVNAASDVFLTQTVNGQLHFCAIQRRDDGTWAMPGGFRNKGEAADTAAFRELEEETGIYLSAVQKKAVAMVYHGYVRDPRNTDDAWIETAVFHLDITGMNVEPARAADDAQQVGWLSLEKAEDVAKIRNGHLDILLQILSDKSEEVDFVGVQMSLDFVVMDYPGYGLSPLAGAVSHIFRIVRHLQPHPKNFLVPVYAALGLLQKSIQFMMDAVAVHLSHQELEVAERHVEHAAGKLINGANAERLQQVIEGYREKERKHNSPDTHKSFSVVPGPSGPQ